MSVRTPLLRWTWSALAGVAIGFFTPDLSAQVRPVTAPPLQSVTILEVKGTVEVLRAGRRLTARAQQALQPGDRVQTALNSHAALLWYDHAAVQASELSEIVIPPPPGPQRRSVLQVLRGFIYLFHRDRPREFEIQTPTAMAVVLGTEFSVRVAADGSTVLMLFDGQVDLSNPLGVVQLLSGQQGSTAPGQAPVVTPILGAVNDLIQWFLYYPAVLDVDEAGLVVAEQQALAASLAAYRSGALPEALASYPAGRQPASDADKIYFAALLLSVGQVDKAEALLATLTPGAERPARLAAALHRLIAAVKGQFDLNAPDLELATGLLAESYYQQSRADLDKALQAARAATERSPQFGYAWARVAELEFSFGRVDPALRALERALELSPRNAQALALNGFLLAAQNRIGRAIEHFEQALALDGGLGNAWLGRGLCHIRRGQSDAGRRDLLVAAAVEPQRALLRSYLGKAFSNAGDAERAAHEIELAQRLDPNDPTAWLYEALLDLQNNRVNEAVRALERSQELYNNRRLYRSRLLLDQDRAVRGANLANIYHDAGMTDVSLREATRAVTAGYANYSAHLFLANSYQQLREPRQVDLRFETATFTEYLLANLLAPVGAGPLSPTVSQQEYSKLFERDGLRLVSSTEYFSRGDWLQSGAQYGQFGDFSYALESGYRSERGQRQNNDQEQLTLSAQVKLQLTPRDTIFVQPIYYHAEGGDLAQRYDPATANLGYRFEERQDPTLLAGYHHEWAPGHHTLLFASRILDTFEVGNTNQGVPLLYKTGGAVALVPAPFTPAATLDYRSEFAGYSAEAQHIWQVDRNTVVIGGRFQQGEFDTRSGLGTSASSVIVNSSGVPSPVPGIPADTSEADTDLKRWSAYAYDYWEIVEPLTLSVGLTYDWLKFPLNHQTPPISAGEGERERWSPKIGLTWQPTARTQVRGAYTRSLGGASFDQSYRLEPTHVAGFNQAFRSLAPESVAGASLAPDFETFGLGADHRFGSGTYVGLEAEWLRSDYTREIGAVDLTDPGGVFVFTPSTTRQSIDYTERSLRATLNQLLGREWSLGARYQLSHADLDAQFLDIPQSAVTAGNLRTVSSLEALLHQLNLFAIYQHPSGFFAQANARWYVQNNSGDASALADEDFWQFDVFAGYRFPQRRVEVRVGLLNFTDQDYRLNPLNLITELPRERTFTASLRFNF